MKTAITLSAIALLGGAAHAAVLAPTDPSINASLGLWLTDAASNFDGSTWTDSSSNGNNATTVGTVNVNAPVTYSAPALDLITTTIDHNTSSVAFAGGTNDLMRAAGINGGSGTNQLTIFVAYNMVALNGTSNLTRPAGFGSIAGTQANPGDHFNLASDPSIRRDNGQIGSGGYGAAAPVGSPFIRIARMDANGADEWFNTTTTMNAVLTDTGTQFTTSNDDFYLGDLRGGSSTVPGFGTATAPSDFSISQVIVFNTALTDGEISDINEFMLTPVPEPGSMALLGLAAIGLLRRRR